MNPNSSDPALLANQLPISLSVPSEWERAQPILELFLKRVSDSVNTKEGGLYNLIETAAFIQYFTAGTPNTFRPVYRMTVNFGALPNATTKSVAHGINFTNAFTATRIYGAATDPTDMLYIPIPYASSTANKNIEIYVDATNVNIVTGINLTAYTTTYVVIEYTKI
jgi:hypothetical protein